VEQVTYRNPILWLKSGRVYDDTSRCTPFQESLGSPASLGERIRAVRITWDWTQGTLAKALGSSQSIVSEWEKDVSRPSGATFVALARLFRLSVQALETGKGFEIPDPPDAKPQGGLMSKRDVEDLKKLLPGLHGGEILQVDTESMDSELVALKDALTALREAKKEGRTVWLVIGDASTKTKR
jgi:transcriptional regulator with XRE-family HTH domain